MLEPRYVRKVELTFKSHVPFPENRVEDVLKTSVLQLVKAASIGSPVRDVSIAIDDIGESEVIGD